MFLIKANEIDAGFGNERCETGDEVLRASCPAPFGPAYGCSKSLPAILSNGTKNICVVPSR